MAVELLPAPEKKIGTKVYLLPETKRNVERIAVASKRSANMVIELLVERAIDDLQREGRFAV